MALHGLASPARFLRISKWLLPLLALVAVGALFYAQYIIWAVAPIDYQQGEFVRLMYLHVPAAWLGLGLYGAMAILSLCVLIWRHPLAHLAAREAAPIGAIFTLLCLLTGALWGKPMWGAYWVWDARLTSMLVLFFLYLGYMALGSAHGENGSERGQIACAWLCLVGAINLPIIKFSVNWWNTLHQPASILRAGGPSIDNSMLMPLLLMLLATSCGAGALLIRRMQNALLAQKLRRLQIRSIARKSAGHLPAETLELE